MRNGVVNFLCVFVKPWKLYKQNHHHHFHQNGYIEAVLEVYTHHLYEKIRNVAIYGSKVERSFLKKE